MVGFIVSLPWLLTSMVAISPGVPSRGARAQRVPPPIVTQTAVEEIRALHARQQEALASNRARAAQAERNLEAMGKLRDSLIPWAEARLEAHDIDVYELHGSLTPEAVARLLAHEVCAVHVRGFCSPEECTALEHRLENASLYSNWHINRNADCEDPGQSTEVDKIGVVYSEAMDSFESFAEYLMPKNGGMDRLLPSSCNPFERLLAQLDDHHPQGCERGRVGHFQMPIGTIRRMHSSRGLVHADTSALLSDQFGEFSANIYIRTPPAAKDGSLEDGDKEQSAQGALAVYPARQYKGDGGLFGVTSPALLADLQSLALRQADGFSPDAQAYLRSALPLRRRLELRDGDLVLINTGRFHEVERYDCGLRLSGQSWISFRRGKPLKLWV
jgi:hypothetical protein